MAHLNLDTALIARCRTLAERISTPVEKMIHAHTTVAIERSVLRLFGAKGAVRERGGQFFPEANIMVEDLRKAGGLANGVLVPCVNGMLQKKMPAAELANAVASRKINLLKLPEGDRDEIESKAR